jgi:alkylated DNA repair dioxygenase AlkB
VNVPFQPSLFGLGDPSADDSFSTMHRVQLDAESWVDLAPGWLRGPDTLFTMLAESVPWEQRERWMYDHRVVEPRLTYGWPAAQAPPPLDDLARLLSLHYSVDFDSVWANYYRDGKDSVAWHGDRVRFTLQRPRVAILSLGSPRRFGMRPRGGGSPQWFTVHGGDLLVMGGRSQHDWLHSVPKAVHGGPRISVTYRHTEPGQAQPASRPAAD